MTRQILMILRYSLHNSHLSFLSRLFAVSSGIRSRTREPFSLLPMSSIYK